ncbi:very short patch repair endonuclease [Pseudomonas viridiflava]|uniref:very short patch repair endonuclease n=1 Tax=Pseudomonas viridiflava TaxID=33069 RepID=UPI000F021508|nr:very short patch repair endonuclease [Pseudomonas viridiflava]MDY0936017.1 very short patch repair endonuclease [Pseudomonas viridiflava]MDY1014063.1 very short patch repair endonuclease [Pseudomonas viridiflava]QXG36597.1 very short patch repair endonuclease [Pseudomonas viridiflava]QXG39740.1 very short patch repair endonuclease [Pseudomonas viridiflava]
MDIVDSATRSRMMSAIKGKNTRPELLVRKFLHAHGFRFRLHRKDLPGNPDIVMPKLKTCIFVHGCFWHRHAGCRYATMPKTRPHFWAEKFAKNVKRDLQSTLALQQSGWTVVTIWECQLKDPEPVMSALINQLNESMQNL